MVVIEKVMISGWWWPEDAGGRKARWEGMRWERRLYRASITHCSDARGTAAGFYFICKSGRLAVKGILSTGQSTRSTLHSTLPLHHQVTNGRAVLTQFFWITNALEQNTAAFTRTRTRTQGRAKTIVSGHGGINSRRAY